jgi:hypothetical protein
MTLEEKKLTEVVSEQPKEATEATTNQVAEKTIPVDII